MSDARTRVMLRGWWAAAAFAVAAMKAWAADAPAPIPVEAFFKKPLLAAAQISPTGRHVALTALNGEGVEQLIILDTSNLSTKVVANFQKHR